MIVRVNQDPKAWLDGMVSRGRKEFFNLPSPIMITPKMAEEMLARNLPGNRNIRPSKIEAYVQTMKDGGWRVTSQGVSFNSKGHLDNGQHRLMAVIKSGCDIPMSVSFGHDVHAYPTLDAGSARTAADVLKHKGVPMGPLVAATAGRIESVLLGATGSRTRRFSHSEILEMVKERPLVIEASKLAMKLKKLGGSPSAIACGLYFCLLDDDIATAEMVERLYDGVGLGANSAIRVMREGLISRKYTNDDKGSYVLAADVVNTYIAWCKGHKRRDKWAHGQPFPLAH